MEPKFQSSFIPRGPAASTSSIPNSTFSSVGRRPVERSLFGVAAGALFSISILFALGVFGYKLFLNYRIGQMGRELEAARAALEPETVNELIRLNSRLVATESLLNEHRIISPVFVFLQQSTPTTVRYTDFAFSMSSKGLELLLHGEAQSYGALASAAEVYNRSDSNFKNAAFSDLQLDGEGNVVFELRLEVEPSLLSYKRFIDLNGPREALIPVAQSTSTTSTTTAPVAPGPGPANASGTPPVIPR